MLTAMQLPMRRTYHLLHVSFRGDISLIDIECSQAKSDVQLWLIHTGLLRDRNRDQHNRKQWGPVPCVM